MSGWTAVVPVKQFALAKTRLGLPPSVRHQLSRAFVRDVLDVLTATPIVTRVVIVTAEPELVLVARQLDAVLIEDRPTQGPDGLNPSICAGRAWAVRRAPSAPLVIVPADLPALTDSTLADALDRLGSLPSAFIPDAAGVGTTLLASRVPQLLTPQYGLGSSGRHAAAGARAMSFADSRVRRDVDTQDDLAAAAQLGLGPCSRAVLASTSVAAAS
ncbi:MAG: 2-phospho-L-lactate/phosphoenolpyruvate guanylyltransferase [Nocardioidaceae bacterium]|jgi:2-phospho-L-lactate guanylyltransferase|nr:2-phospho-L-lactate/phosphoenolpyruvate guanylyltransferase [Nocardioidaceae bacterium]